MKITQKLWASRLLIQSAKNQLPRGFKMTEMMVINYVQRKDV